MLKLKMGGKKQHPPPLHARLDVPLKSWRKVEVVEAEGVKRERKTVLIDTLGVNPQAMAHGEGKEPHKKAGISDREEVE